MLTGRRASVAGEGEHMAVRPHASKCVEGCVPQAAGPHLVFDKMVILFRIFFL